MEWSFRNKNFEKKWDKQVVGLSVAALFFLFLGLYKWLNVSVKNWLNKENEQTKQPPSRNPVLAKKIKIEAFFINEMKKKRNFKNKKNLISNFELWS